MLVTHCHKIHETRTIYLSKDTIPITCNRFPAQKFQQSMGQTMSSAFPVSLPWFLRSFPRLAKDQRRFATSMGSKSSKVLAQVSTKACTSTKNQSQSVETKQIMQQNMQKCEESWQVIRSGVFWRRSEDCNYMTFPSTSPGPFASRNASPGWYPKRAQAQRLLTMSCAQLEHRMDLRCLGFLYPFRSKNELIVANL